MARKNLQNSEQILIGYNNPVVVVSHSQTNSLQIRFQQVELGVSEQDQNDHRNAVEHVFSLRLVLPLLLQPRVVVQHESVCDINEALHRVADQQVELRAQLQLLRRQVLQHLAVMIIHDAHFLLRLHAAGKQHFDLLHDSLQVGDRGGLLPDPLQKKLDARRFRRLERRRGGRRKAHEIGLLAVTRANHDYQLLDGLGREEPVLPQRNRLDHLAHEAVQVLRRTQSTAPTPSINRRYSG